MYDRGLSVLEQYGLHASSTCRGRGALLCRTEAGLVLIREFNGSRKKLEKQQELLEMLAAKGHLVDVIVRNGEDGLVTQDKEGVWYVVRNWYDGRECDTKSRKDILKSVAALADLHIDMQMPAEADYVEESLCQVYIRHNRELKKIQKFIRRKQKQNNFERAYLSSVEWFLQQGERAVDLLDTTGNSALQERARQQGWVCHGEYNQHNVLMGEQCTAVTNFDRWSYDVQTADLYRFMRKILEKYNWDFRLAREMLKTYSREKPLSEEELVNLKVHFMYPEKYWKLANYYYTHNKAWISEKNVEKLQTLIRQKDTWQEFGQTCFEKLQD